MVSSHFILSPKANLSSLKRISNLNYTFGFLPLASQYKDFLNDSSFFSTMGLSRVPNLRKVHSIRQFS
jgi:hypothetical protein